MSSTGCGFLFFAALALVMGMIPILAWTNLVITLPLALIGAISTASHARRPAAQSADKVIFLLALGLIAVIAFRVVVM